MKQANRGHWFRHIAASTVLVTYTAGCTHMPSGEKAFKDFDSCFAANLAIAAAGGIGVGLLSAHLSQQATSNKSTANAVGVAAGIAAATMIGMVAWRKCAAVYNTSQPIAPATVPHATHPEDRPPGVPRLSLDRLEVRVEGSENDPPVPEFDVSLATASPAAKDITAKFRHKVEIVRFMADQNDKLVLAGPKGEPLLDTAGKPIPLEAAIRMPRNRLQWVAIADAGKDDYVEDVVIQAGQKMGYRHKLNIPPRAQLPLPLPVPMRYTLTVEAEGMTSARTVDFALLGNADRPKRYVAAAGGASDVTGRSLKGNGAGALAGFVATHATKHKVTLYDSAGTPHKTVATLKAGTRVQMDEQRAIAVHRISTLWFRISSETGVAGWVRSAELKKLK